MGSSETGDVSHDNAKADFPINMMLKWWEWFHTIGLTKIKNFTTYKNL